MLIFFNKSFFPIKFFLISLTLERKEGENHFYCFVCVDIFECTNPRSRLYVADWNGDGLSDLLVGGADGKVMLYAMAPEPISSVLFIIGGGVLGAAKLRKKFSKKT